MLITHKITMDIQRFGIMPYLDVVCGDAYTRKLELTLFSGGAEWPVPAGVSVVVRYSRSDGYGGLYDTLPNGKAACSFDKNVVTAILAPQVLSAPGFAKVSVALVKGELVLGMFPVGINIKADPSMGVTKGENYYNYPSIGTINDAIGDLSKLQTAAKGNLVEAINEAARSGGNDSSQNGNQGSGLTTAVKNALLNAFAHVAWTDENGQSYYDALATALNSSGSDSGDDDSGDEGGTTVVTLSSISAVYGGGDVASGTALSDLTDIVVTAHYSDGSTKTITGYELSGEIATGTNTITVSYGGMTTTFEVVGTADTRTYLEFDATLNMSNWNGSAYSDDGETSVTPPSAKGYIINQTFDEDVEVHFKITWGAATVWRNLAIASAVPGTLDANNACTDMDTMYRLTSMANYYVEGDGTSYCFAGNVYEGTYSLKAGCVLLICGMNINTAGQHDADNTYFYVEG